VSELAILALLGALAALGIVALRRGQLGPMTIWAWSWLVLFGAFLCVALEGAVPWARALAPVFAAVFPVVQYAGARSWAGRPSSLVWPAVAVGVGALRSGLAQQGWPEAQALVLALWDPAWLVAAAWVVARARSSRAPTPSACCPSCCWPWRAWRPPRP